MTFMSISESFQTRVFLRQRRNVAPGGIFESLGLEVRLYEDSISITSYNSYIYIKRLQDRFP